MARPIKDNADYFTHDADMRDDPKIKALRRKFKVAGYGVWCMLLEAITDSDNFRLTVDLEIIAGDFDVETDFLQQVIQYCIQIDLLQTDEGCKTLWSKTLDKRFDTLLSKRKRDRGELSTAKTPQNGVIASESTQSKVKESKVQKSKALKPLRSFEVPFVDEVLKAWEEWEQYRKEREKKLTPSTVKKQIQFLGGRGDPEIIAIINQSITNGWIGLFDLNNKTQHNARPGNKRSSDAVIPAGREFGSFDDVLGNHANGRANSGSPSAREGKGVLPAKE